MKRYLTFTVVTAKNGGLSATPLNQEKSGFALGVEKWWSCRDFPLPFCGIFTYIKDLIKKTDMNENMQTVKGTGFYTKKWFMGVIGFLVILPGVVHNSIWIWMFGFGCSLGGMTHTYECKIMPPALVFSAFIALILWIVLLVFLYKQKISIKTAYVVIGVALVILLVPWVILLILSGDLIYFGRLFPTGDKIELVDSLTGKLFT